MRAGSGCSPGLRSSSYSVPPLSGCSSLSSFLQVTALALICGMLWFHAPQQTASDIQDKVGRGGEGQGRKGEGTRWAQGRGEECQRSGDVVLSALPGV